MDPAIGPTSNPQEAGFTLIELLVSVAILSVLAVGASLAVSRGGNGGQSDLALFQTRHETMRQLAITGQQSRGLAITSRGLQPVIRRSDGWQEAGRLQPWRGRVLLSAEPAGPPGAPMPDIVFLATGQTNRFRIAFGASARCESDGWAGLTCSAG
ncbi:prepilin-type N-terminal cleavage/methylation domain-containing protein [Tropicibacter oceani]|uniref:Prepilin-type N-terminal cleavage/methylation domain-containing protein n=1 Tax=Tropicibacter oceani TaxID=3058420 RepID=A0ABY8QPF5_9RHOB|nr:prepilin-type N-terminal cleavage/methylation domain-containing protein [Tropicibacter oceani]WGW05911.1 prepilin-type N-terminal cleavage/methylation domain-containing protein [Tropicibacter oceani]